MTVPPKQNELFKWKKGAKRLSDWMVQGGFAPIDEAIGSLKSPTLVAPPPLHSPNARPGAKQCGNVWRGERAFGP